MKTALEITENYITYTLENERRPVSIYKFCKEFKLEEKDFYSHFGNLNQVESLFWKNIINSSYDTATKHSEGINSPNELLLNFYYVLLENMKLNRSFILFIFSESHSFLHAIINIKPIVIEALTKIKNSFTLLDQISESLSNKITSESIFIQFASILKFWIDDDSRDFEKTDAYVEKSIKLISDLEKSIPLESILDFGKFIVGEFKSHR